MNDLQAIAIAQGRLGPAIARDDLAIQLDCYAIRLHAELVDEGCESFSGGGLWLAVDGQVHRVYCRISRILEQRLGNPSLEFWWRKRGPSLARDGRDARPRARAYWVARS